MKKYITIIVVFFALVISFGYYTLFTSPAKETVNQIEKNQNELAVKSIDDTEEEVEQLKGVGTLESLRQSKKDLECTILDTINEQSTKIEGTYFVSDESMRGDFLIPSPDLSGQVLSSIIFDKDIVYIWSEIDGEKYGVRTTLDKVLDTNVKTIEPVSLNDNVHYDCKSWKNVDGTIFLPPTDVIFREFDSLIQTGMEYGTIYKAGSELPY